MPLFGRDRYQRLDGGGPGRKPSSFCSSATIVVFVALCLVGAWMMSSSSNIPVTPEKKRSEAKEADDLSVDSTQSDNAAPGTGIEASGDTTGTKDGGDKGATQTADAGSSNDTTTGGEEVGGDTGQAAVAEGETASKNQTFSDENGATEGGEVSKLEDPEKNGATEGGEVSKPEDPEKNGVGQPDENNKPEATGDKDKVSKSGLDPSNDDDTGVQADSNIQDRQETPTDVSGVSTKNQTTFDDANNNRNKVDGEKPANEAAGNEKVSTSGNETEKGPEEAALNDDSTAGAVATNGTWSVEQTEAVAFAVGDDDTTNNSTISQDTENATSSTTTDEKTTAEVLPSGQADLLNETSSSSSEPAFPTQAAESISEKKKKKKNKNKNKKNKPNNSKQQGVATSTTPSHDWKLCNTSAGADYIPCLDNDAAIKKLKTTKHYEHRERHCPSAPPTCLVPLPDGYRTPIPWPSSRDKIRYHNVPHTRLAAYKGHQNWVKVSGEHLTFPGGGTQFKHGAAHYIDVMQESLPPEVLAWGTRSRVALDVGCGVASFGGFLFDRDVLTMSFAPKDEHEAQVQFALERGIPAVSAVMGTLRLPFPGNVFDVVHCARCRVPWHIEGGKLLLEVNRLLRPGGVFVWSATPVYRKVPEDVQIWHAMAALTKSMCWEMVKRTSDTVDQTAMVVFKKPTTNDCYDNTTTTMCEAADDQDAAWNVTLQPCMHRVPVEASARGARWPAPWPDRLAAAPYWLRERSRRGPTSPPTGSTGGAWFAAALQEMKVWVMNVVPLDSPDTLPIIYERGLFGMYHDWCESFSTYPRSYDLLHADHLFSRIKSRCGTLLPAMVEADRILRPEGTLIVRDDRATVQEVQGVAKSLHWEVRITVSSQGEELLCVRKTTWRPTQVEKLSS
ncbi:hypothetical protein PR202_ga03861 [Eleusine coracana subsp. coracana]|uniref:Methyltransferase PMT26 n=1 Tax=Eleusine coracana subsp. coracana TaxID=191504 RepID=A0AAV5BQ39_ELECO|nr:hypothetical protein PR202_ga03861 [Eleusine coracana subsp. coracana]